LFFNEIKILGGDKEALGCLWHRDKTNYKPSVSLSLAVYKQCPDGGKHAHRPRETGERHLDT